MKAVEFIKMQKQDIETHKDKIILSEVVAVMSEVLKSIPEAEIEEKKTAEDCYKQMYEYARKNQSNNAYVFTHTGMLQFISKYLGLPETYEQQERATVNIEKKRRSLEDFF